jgi:sigma-E factor negative regulatory protein RseA
MHIEQEVLSAAIDGVHDAASDQVLQGIAGQEITRDCWARYHLIGDVLRDGLVDVASKDFSQRLRTQINDEPRIVSPRKRSSSYRRPLAGLAIAASVAAIAIIGVGRIAPESPTPARIAVSPDITLATPAQPQFVARPEIPPAISPAPLVEATPALYSQRRLNGYLVKFNEQRSSVGIPGVNPYVRIVGFETE